MISTSQLVFALISATVGVIGLMLTILRPSSQKREERFNRIEEKLDKVDSNQGILNQRVTAMEDSHKEERRETRDRLEKIFDLFVKIKP